MRDVFDRYIGAAPAPGFDLDALARRGRQIRRRRTAYAGGGVALAISAGVVGLALLPPKAAAPPPPGTATSASPAVSPSATPPAEAEADRLLAALKDAIARQAPGITGIDTLQRYANLCAPDANGDTRVPWTPQVAPTACPGDDDRTPDRSRQYYWQGRLTAPSGVYAISVFIAPTTYVDPTAQPVGATEAEERRIAEQQGEAPRRGPDGESILAKTFLLNMSKPGGTGILIRVGDADRTGAWATRSPFTADQLAAIGLDPRLHL